MRVKNFLLIFLLSITSLSFAAGTCESLFSISKSELIQQHHLQELVIETSDGFSGIELFNGYFRRYNFKTFDEVQKRYEKVPLKERYVLSSLIQKRKILVPEVKSRLMALSLEEGGSLYHRTKDRDSLLHKILDRVNEFAMEGEFYTLKNLADVEAFRLVVPPHSKLLDKKTPNQWAEKLNVELERVLEVEIKGTEEHIAKGKNYSATHLNIESIYGQNYELQVMSLPMSVWHSWDHKNVYKAKNKNSLHWQKLKLYSQNWSSIIRQLEVGTRSGQYDLVRGRILSELGLHQNATFKDLNKAIKLKLNLEPELGLTTSEILQIERSFSPMDQLRSQFELI